MTENEALQMIKEKCNTRDKESNGCNLDGIISEFLRAQGFSKLADAADNVECWRA